METSGCSPLAMVLADGNFEVERKLIVLDNKVILPSYWDQKLEDCSAFTTM